MNLAQYIDQPREVSIETFALCNARCTFCPYPTLDRKGVKMSDELILRLIDEMSEFRLPFYFSPFKVNEPLLDDRLPEICRRFEEKCALGRLRLFTNGSALTNWWIYQLIALERVEHLWISLNSTDPEEYKQIMGLNFDITAKRLDRLHAIILDSESVMPWKHAVIVSKVADDDGEKNLKFVQDCRARWPLFQAGIIKRDGWLGYVEPGNAFIPNQPCSRWFELSVMATGVVSLCCMDGTGAYAIGDITRHSLREVYNEPTHRERRMTAVTRHRYDPCRRCTY